MIREYNKRKVRIARDIRKTRKGRRESQLVAKAHSDGHWGKQRTYTLLLEMYPHSNSNILYKFVTDFIRVIWHTKHDATTDDDDELLDEHLKIILLQNWKDK